MVVFNWYGFWLAMLVWIVAVAAIPLQMGAGITAYYAISCPLLGAIFALTFDRYDPDRSWVNAGILRRAMMPYYSELRKLSMVEDDSTARIAFFGCPIALWPQVTVIGYLGWWGYTLASNAETSWTTRDWLIGFGVSVLSCAISLIYASATSAIRERDARQIR